MLQIKIRITALGEAMNSHFIGKCHQCMHKNLIKFKITSLAGEEFVSHVLYLNRQFIVPEHYRGYLPI